MVDESRNGDSKVRVVRLLGHRDDAGAWEIRDFLKRSVVEFQWIELLTEQPRLWRGSPVLEGLMSADAQPDALDVSFPTRRILAIVGDKWTTVVLYYLSIREHRRFTELQKQIPDISKKMLVQTLRNLERDGLLERTVYQQEPPKTEYRLTDKGHKLREPIAWLCEWGMNNREFIDGIIKARAGAVLTGDAHRP